MVEFLFLSFVSILNFFNFSTLMFFFFYIFVHFYDNRRGNLRAKKKIKVKNCMYTKKKWYDFHMSRVLFAIFLTRFEAYKLVRLSIIYHEWKKTHVHVKTYCSQWMKDVKKVKVPKSERDEKKEKRANQSI